jgi:hypothetical protein
MPPLRKPKLRLFNRLRQLSKPLWLSSWLKMPIEIENRLASFHLWIFPCVYTCHEVAPSRLCNESTVIRVLYDFRPARGLEVLKVSVQEELKTCCIFHLEFRHVVRSIRGLRCRRKIDETKQISIGTKEASRSGDGVLIFFNVLEVSIACGSMNAASAKLTVLIVSSVLEVSIVCGGINALSATLTDP